MTFEDVQSLLVTALVAAAGVYLLRTSLKALLFRGKNAAGCGASCSGCASPGPGGPLVSLQPMLPKKRAESTATGG